MSALEIIRNHYDSLRGQEAWRYTSLSGLLKQDLTLAKSTSFGGTLPRLLEQSVRLVVVNGVLDETASDPLPAGISKTAPSHTADDPLHAARQTGYALEISGHITPVIEILHISHAQDGVIPIIMPRHSIKLARGADVTILTHYTGTGTYALHQHLAIELGDGARLRHYRLQDEARASWHLSHIDCVVGRDAVYDNFTLSLGATLSRNEMHMKLAGLNAEGHLNGAYLLHDTQHADNTSKIDHLLPHGRSNQTYKGVIADRGRGVFQGKIHVHPDAQKTDGYQLNQALLLSDQAEINSKPELEIYADDVKCSHGATVGQLDTKALFYLRSRGIPEDAARGLLVQSFVGGALDLITHDDVRDVFYEKVSAWLLSQNA